MKVIQETRRADTIISQGGKGRLELKKTNDINDFL
jgi:hypothetical protein